MVGSGTPKPPCRRHNSTKPWQRAQLWGFGVKLTSWGWNSPPGCSWCCHICHRGCCQALCHPWFAQGEQLLGEDELSVAEEGEVLEQPSFATLSSSPAGLGWFHSASDSWQGTSSAHWSQSPVLRNSPSVIWSKSSHFHPLIPGEFCRLGRFSSVVVNVYKVL